MSDERLRDLERLATMAADEARERILSLPPARLTFIAEKMGVVPQPLLELIVHTSPLVREGAVLGLSRLVQAAREAIQNATLDTSPGVRRAAKEALEEGVR